MSAQRNQPCQCGSGKKHKHCCEGKRRSSSHWLAIASVILFAVAAVWVLAGVVRRAAEPAAAAPQANGGQVWSEEHGHWHSPDGTPGTPRPSGPGPPGKVWSNAHGHWHDGAGEPESAPPGPAPPGKVWSAEHGHWHDDPTGGPVAVEPVDNPESSVSYVD